MTGLKRQWKEVAVTPGEAGQYGIALDGKPVHLPSKAPLQVKSRALAEALADEWGAPAMSQAVNPEALPLTRIAGNCIDRIAPDMRAMRARLLPFGRDDSVCYRHVDQEGPVLDKVLAWARENGLTPAFTDGIMPLEQPPAYMEALADYLGRKDAEDLAALGVMAPALGSLLLPLALMDGVINVEEAARLANAEEYRQLREGGHDEDLARRLRQKEEDVRQARHYLTLAKA